MEARDLFPQLETLDALALNARYLALRDIPKHDPDSATGLPCACGQCQTDEHLGDDFNSRYLAQKERRPAKGEGNKAENRNARAGNES